MAPNLECHAKAMPLVWDRDSVFWGTDRLDKKSDFEGLTLHRAACTAAMSRSALDLMRLSREVFALRNQVPEVAILWSNGGVLLAYGEDNLRKDEYGRKVEPPAFAREIPRGERGENLAEILKTELRRAGVECGVSVVDPQGKLPYGVEWRSAVLNGHTLVNLANFSRKPVSVRLPKGSWQDLIALQPLPTEITLLANTPVLAKSLNQDWVSTMSSYSLRSIACSLIRSAGPG